MTEFGRRGDAYEIVLDSATGSWLDNDMSTATSPNLPPSFHGFNQNRMPVEIHFSADALRDQPTEEFLTTPTNEYETFLQSIGQLRQFKYGQFRKAGR